MAIIVRTLGANFIQSKINLVVDGKYLLLSDCLKPGEVVFGVFHPTLIDGFLALEVLGERVRVAISDGNDCWKGYIDGAWEAVLPEDRYRSPEEIKAGISQWAGALQLAVRLNPVDPGTSRTWNSTACLKEIKIGYEVRQDLPSYLLEVALVEKLKVPLKLERIVEVGGDGLHVPFPLGFSRSELSNIRVKPFNALSIAASPVLEIDRIELASSLPPGEPVQLLFSIIPAVDYSYRLYQIDRVPLVLVRSLQEEQPHKPYFQESIQAWDGVIHQDGLTYCTNLAVEITCFAGVESDALAIARALVAEIYRDNTLHSHPHGLTFGIQRLGGIMLEKSPDLIQGALPGASFKLRIVNVSA